MGNVSHLADARSRTHSPRYYSIHMISCLLLPHLLTPGVLPAQLAKQLGLHGSCARETPCTGVTPKGNRWVYAMPSHTGTGTAAHFLMQHTAELNITSCAHSGHAVCPPAGSAVAFTWVANPFRRVLSNAAYRGAISGSRRTFNRTTTEEVAALASYVRRLHYIDKDIVSIAPHGQNMAVQVEYLRRFPAPTKFVGRTALLQEDMQRLFSYLGYNSIAAHFTETHCGASCAKSNRAGGAGGGLFNASWKEVRKEANLFENIQWYDASTSRIIVDLFRADFEAFNFSTDPRRMWEVPPEPNVPFLMPPRASHSKKKLAPAVGQSEMPAGTVDEAARTQIARLAARVDELERKVLAAAPRD